MIDLREQLKRMRVIAARLDRRWRPARPRAETPADPAERACGQPEPLQPGERQQRRVDLAASSLRSRVSTLPRSTTVERSGRNRFTIADGAATPCRPPHHAATREARRLAARRHRARPRAAGRRRASTRRAAGSACPSPNAPRCRSAEQQRLLDLLGEQSLAPGLAQRPVLDTVAGGADRLDLDRRHRSTLRRRERGTDQMRLRQRERAAARADARTMDCVTGPPMVREHIYRHSAADAKDVKLVAPEPVAILREFPSGRSSG